MILNKRSILIPQKIKSYFLFQMLDTKMVLVGLPLEADINFLRVTFPRGEIFTNVFDGTGTRIGVIVEFLETKDIQVSDKSSFDKVVNFNFITIISVNVIVFVLFYLTKKFINLVYNK